MQNSDEVLDYIEKIAATSSRTEKERLVAEGIAFPIFKATLQWAYDPFITFGIKPKKPSIDGDGHGFTLDPGGSVEWALTKLSTRALSGNAAQEAVAGLYLALSPKSRELLWRILSKDLRAGFTGNTVNRVLPGTVPSFDVMLSHKFEGGKRIKQYPVGVEPKLDGVRVICLYKEGKAQFFSRNGNVFPALEHLASAIVEMVKGTKNFIHDWPHDAIAFDGEMMSGEFNAASGAIRRQSEAALDAEYHIFDIMDYAMITSNDKKLKSAVDYRTRRALVGVFLGNAKSDKIKGTPCEEANSADEVIAIYEKHRAAGLEGVIVKPFDGLYEKRRSYNWQKVKAEETIELRVTGAYEGEGKYAGSLGGLHAEGEHPEKGHIKTDVGGGFSDQQRAEMWAAYQSDVTNIGVVPTERLELVGRMIEVEYHEVTPYNALRHPRFVRFRDDKDEKLKDAA